MVERNTEKPIDVILMQKAVAVLALRIHPPEKREKYLEVLSGTLEDKYKGDEESLRFAREYTIPGLRRLFGLSPIRELVLSAN